LVLNRLAVTAESAHQSQSRVWAYIKNELMFAAQYIGVVIHQNDFGPTPTKSKGETASGTGPSKS